MLLKQRKLRGTQHLPVPPENLLSTVISPTSGSPLGLWSESYLLYLRRRLWEGGNAPEAAQHRPLRNRCILIDMLR